LRQDGDTHSLSLKLSKNLNDMTMHYLNNLIVEPLCNYSNAIGRHESPYCCHNNDDQHIEYGCKADLLSLQYQHLIDRYYSVMSEKYHISNIKNSCSNYNNVPFTT